MPFYAYKCDTCKKTFKAFHTADECETKCIVCSSDKISKLVGTIRTVVEHKNNSSAKDRVEKFIEDSRQTLKEQMQEARKEYK